MPTPKPTKPTKGKVPPKREPVSKGRDLEWDLTEVDDTSMNAELIRRGWRPMVPPPSKQK